MSADTKQSAPAAARNAAAFLDERLGAAKVVRGAARKIFPDHWSFMLGEVALYSFVILLLSGVFLTFWFDPSMHLMTYKGSYEPMYGQEMSVAFASTLALSFDVGGGLLMRQIHHWSALMFVASMIAHMFRVFFTGAFRKPRELNWALGSILALLGLGAGFTGYSLPDDLLSGNGLRIIDGVLKSIPFIGSYASLGLFGGEFPGESVIPRLYIIHVLLIPGIILAAIGAHVGMVALHKHTQYPGPGRTNKNVVGFPLLPVYAAKAGGFFFIVFGVIALMGAFVSINPVWNYGPYDPSPISAGTQPDFYIGFIDGALRLIPNSLEFSAFGYTFVGSVFAPAAILPGILTGILIAYPFIESWVTGDKREHHILDRPRNVPTRTALGVMAIVSYCVMWAAAGNDLIATHFDMSINDLTWTLRISFFVLPPLAFIITKRICIALQRRDKELALHGLETGRVVRTADGEYFEVHEPLNEYDRWILVQHESPEALTSIEGADENGVRRPGSGADKARLALSRFFFQDRLAPATPKELAEAHEHGHHGDDHDEVDSAKAKAELH